MLVWKVQCGFNNNVYRVIHRDAYDGIPVGSLWVLHMKFKPDNTIDKARGRLTIRGDQTIEKVFTIMSMKYTRQSESSLRCS